MNAYVSKLLQVWINFATFFSFLLSTKWLKSTFDQKNRVTFALIVLFVLFCLYKLAQAWASPKKFTAGLLMCWQTRLWSYDRVCPIWIQCTSTRRTRCHIESAIVAPELSFFLQLGRRLRCDHESSILQSYATHGVGRWTYPGCLLRRCATSLSSNNTMWVEGKTRHTLVGHLPLLIFPLQTSHCPLLCPL